MINYDDVKKRKRKDHNPNWPQIPDNPCRKFIYMLRIQLKQNIDILFNKVKKVALKI